MKNKIIELIASNTLDDIVLGLILMSENLEFSDLFIYRTAGALRHLYIHEMKTNLRGHLYIRHRIYWLVHSKLYEVNPEKRNKTNILYTDGTI